MLRASESVLPKSGHGHSPFKSLCPTQLLETGQPHVFAPFYLLLLQGDFSLAVGLLFIWTLGDIAWYLLCVFITTLIWSQEEMNEASVRLHHFAWSPPRAFLSED